MTPADPALKLGRYSLSANPDAALALRGKCFRGGASDRDALDDTCHHLAIADTASGTTVAAFRILLLPPDALRHSYSARFYDLTRLAALSGPFLELGRFCLHPDWHDPDILRLAWAGLAQIVDRHGVTLLFGCSSFHGTDPVPHLDAFAHLAARHLAPPDRAPLRRAGAVDYPALTAGHPADPKRALATLPPLLRTYLTMGGWVSDHAVIDRDLNTLHVFTGVEIARIPPARARLLRALAIPPA